MREIVLLIAVAAAVSGCATAPEELPTDKGLYEEAKELQSRADYESARDKFDELVATYPASAYSQQGMLDLSYLHYSRGEYENARDVADRFMLAYPDHDSVGYALYLKGLAYFQDEQNIIDRIGFQDPTERNPESMRQAFATFKQLTEQYPRSRYAEDAAARMRYLINALSRGEVHIANYYLRRGAPLAAVGRAKRVLENYPDSAAAEDALQVLARAYRFMGAEEDMQKARRLLELNFPQTASPSESDSADSLESPAPSDESP